MTTTPQPGVPGDATVTLDDAFDGIRSMRLRGAAKIGRTAAAALALLARQVEPGNDEATRRTFRDAGQHLIEARPTAVTLRNAVNLCLDGIQREHGEAIADRVEAQAEAFIEASRGAETSIASLGADLLPDDAVILTHCHSSLAVAVIAEAQRRGKVVRAFADETRPWWQGHITARQLHDAGVDTTLIVDSAAHHIMRTEAVNAVVIGADAVTADGALYNKVGTHAVALGARAYGIPVYCAAGMSKFSPYSVRGEAPLVEERGRGEVIDDARSQDAGLDDVPVRNPVFDRTEGDLVKTYLTEHGPIAPPDVTHAIDKHFGSMEGWL